MAQGWDNSADSPYTFDGQNSYVGGMVSYSDPRLLSPSQASGLFNSEIAITGQVSLRYGTQLIGTTVGSSSLIDGIIYSNYPGQIYEVAFSGGSYYKWTGATWSLLTTFGTGGKPVSIVQGNLHLYAVEGGSTGSDILQLDGASQADLTGNGSTQAPWFVSYLLWHANRLVAYGPFIKSLSTDPTPLSDAVYFSNILDPLTWGTTKNNNQLRVGAGDPQAIVSIVPWTNFNLAVFKRNSTYVIDANPLQAVSDMPIQLVHPYVGCVANRTAVQVGNDVMFLSDDGVRSLEQVIGSEQQNQLAVPISYPIQDYVNNINWPSASTACAVFWRNLYILAVPYKSSTTNNYLFVYNTLTSSWAGIWTLPHSISCFSVRYVSGVPHLFAGLQNTNKVIEFLDFTQQVNWTNATWQDYDSSTPAWLVISRGYTFGEPLSAKIGIGGELEWNNSTGTATIGIVQDERFSQDAIVSPGVSSAFQVSIPLNSGGITPPVTPPITLSAIGISRSRFDLMRYGEFRGLQIVFTCSGAGRKEVRQVAAGAVVRTTQVGES